MQRFLFGGRDILLVKRALEEKEWSCKKFTKYIPLSGM